MPHKSLLKKVILGLLVVVIGSPPLLVFAQAQLAPRALFENSPTYEVLFSSLILQAIQQALPPDVQAELVSYDVSLRDSEQTDEVVRGEGAWSVTVRYTQGDSIQLDTLRGDAAFSVALLEDRSSGSVVTLRGSLVGAISTATIDAQVVSRFVPGVDYTQEFTFDVNLTLNGTAYPTRAERVERRFSPAFDVEERVTINTVTQSDETNRLENRIVTRFVDLENSEVWIETTGTGAENFDLRAHFWSSITSGVGFEYAVMDYALTIDGQIAARLAEPGTLSFNADGVQGSLVLIDEAGERFTIDGSLLSLDPPAETTGTPRRFRQPRTTAPRHQPAIPAQEARPPMPILAMPLFGPCADAANAAGGAAGAAAGVPIGTAFDVADALDDFSRGMAGAGLRPTGRDIGAVVRNSAESSLRSGATGAITGIVFGAVTNVIANRIKDRINRNPRLSDAERARRARAVDVVTWAANVLMGAAFVTTGAGLAAAVIVAAASFPGGPLDALTGAASGAAGGLCNADPYFTQPDSPTRLLRSRAGPVEIRFVQQGTYEQPPPGSPPSDASSAPVVEFRDNPNPLLAGAVPTGAVALGAWVWDDTRPFNGQPSHRSAGTGVHYFIGAEPYTLADDEELIQYVYLNPDNPPRQIYVQIYTGDGNGEQRAYWGQNLAQTGGEGGTASLYPMGPMPPAGQWLRLRIPAEALELRGQPITGVLFGVVEGEAWWGTTTSAPRATDTAPDVKAVSGGLTRLPAQAGVQIGVHVREAGLLNAQVVTADGAVVRTLWNAPVQRGLRILTWDGTAEDGSPAPAGAKSVVVALDGVEIARADVGSPTLTAQLLSPGPYAVIRGNTVPIIGMAEGAGFQQYILEFGEGANPTDWTRISSSVTPAPLPRPERRVGFAQANLGVWNVGLDEFGSYSNAGLHGLYTLRLRVIGADGDEAVATVPVVVGRLAAFATGNTLTSPDGVAQLDIPPGALTETFVLIGILPVEQTQPPQADLSLPPDLTPASGLYEILPPEDRFGDVVTLSIRSERADAVLMLGDGTADGWRALPTTFDPAQQRLSAPVLDFGQRERALIGAFVGDNLPLAAPAAPAFVTAPSLAPRLIADPQAVAFYDDFASGGAWRLLDQSGTQAEVVPGAAVGLPDGTYALRVTRATRTGARYIQITDAPFDAAQFPIVTFDYRVQPGDGFNLLARVGDQWLQVDMSGVYATASGVRTAQGTRLIADGAWHTAQIDLYRLLQEAFPSISDFTVNQLALGQFERLAYDQVLAVDRGVEGQSYEVARVAVLRPTNRASIQLLTREESSDLIVNGQAGSEVSLPNTDGLYWLEVQHAGHAASAFYPVLVDRTPPQFLNQSPAEGGVGSPFSLSATLSELSGLDLTQARLSVNGVDYSLPRRGLIVEPPTITLLLGSLAPAPALPHQTEVVVALTGASDYAGNSQPVPFEWRFTVNTSPVQRDDLRQVSSGGASTPALSPQGEFIAYVADRDSQPALLIARTDAPQTTLAALPNSRSAAWSPAGDRIAYVQRTMQGDALQIADFNADGTLGSPTTLLSASFVESPSWSPDGEDLAVVVDGNVARVHTRTRAVEPLTNDPERPYRAVAWSRDGSALALAFDLYERRLELLRLADGSITPLTEGLAARQPAWLNASTVLFSAPRAGDRGTQIWQIDINSRAAQPFDLDAPPGADDDQIVVSADGGTLAFVSTRGGERDVWVQRALQIADLRLIPAEVAPGEPIQIAYTLPADATVSVAAAGVAASTIATEQAQSRGLQQLTWDTTGLSEGVYQVRIAAQVGDRVIEQAAEVRLVATTAPPTPTVPPPVTPQPEATVTPRPAVSIGRLEVNAYRDESSSLRADNLLVEVFSADTETLVDRSERSNPVQFLLEAGRYDVRLTYQNAAGETITHTFRAVEVIANEQASVSHPAATGELRVEVLSSEDVVSFNDARVFIYRAGDRETVVGDMRFGTSLRTNLQEGVYDVVVQLRTSLAEELTHIFADVRVEAGRTMRLAHIFPTGRVNITSNAGDEQAAFRTPNVTVFAVGDRTTPLANSTVTNPAVFVLPAGRYDFVMSNPTSLALPDEHTFENVEVIAGQTLDLVHNFQTGRVNITSNAGDGQAAFRTPNVTVFAVGDRTTPLASSTVTNPAVFILPAGRYDFVVSNPTSLAQPDEHTFENVEVLAGQVLDLAHSFQTGRVNITSNAGEGQAAFRTPNVTVFAVGDRTTPLASSTVTNPAVFVLPAGRYDFVMSNPTSLVQPDEHTFENVEVIAGQILDLAHSFQTGRVNVTANAGEDQRAFRDPTVAVFAAGDRSEPLHTIQFFNPAVFILPAGRYDFVVSNPTSLAQPDEYTFENVEVLAGQILDLAHSFQTGRVNVAANAGEDQRAFRDPIVLVFAAGESDRPNVLLGPRGEAEPLAEVRFFNPATFVLPAGRYDFVLRNVTSLPTPDEHRFNSVEVVAGQTLDLVHVFPTGRISLRLLASDGRTGVTGRFAVFPLGQAAPILEDAIFGDVGLVLPAGRYRVELRSREGALLHTFTEVELLPGQTLDLTHQLAP
jgi:hypothetical protein